MMNKVEPSFVDVGKARLYVERLIPPVTRSSTVLVFLHDAIGSTDQWRGFPEEVVAATGCQGLVYDRRGYGRSEPWTEERTPRYLEEEALEVLPQLLQACGVRDLVLIGHSDGASISLIFAGRCPPAFTLKGVVSEAAHVFVEDITIAGIRKAVALAAATSFLQNLSKYHGGKTQTVFDGWHRTWLRDDYRAWNIEHNLCTIRCPLLIIQGEDDEYGSTAQVEAIASQTGGPQKTLLIPDCAHIPHYQAHDLVLAEITAFVRTRNLF